MKNLIIVRHAKSTWEIPCMDKERPLIQRGIEDAYLVASYAKKIIPEKFSIFSSKAKRASQTAEIFSKTFEYPLENIDFIEDLYTFDFNQLAKVIKSLPNSCFDVILFGHNEAITDFVNKFGDIYIDNIPTSGLVWLQFQDNEWNNINKAKTVKTLFPKFLK